MGLWAALGLSVGDLIMARRQLLNLKQLAEQHQHQGRRQELASRPIRLRQFPHGLIT
jgi:hypothetical protein